jgi:hypothetical protein
MVGSMGIFMDFMGISWGCSWGFYGDSIRDLMGSDLV